MEVGSLDRGKHRKWDPKTPGLPPQHPISYTGFSRTWGPLERSLCFWAQFPAGTLFTLFTSSLCRRRPVRMWGFVVWAGFVSLPIVADGLQ